MTPEATEGDVIREGADNAGAAFDFALEPLDVDNVYTAIPNECCERDDERHILCLSLLKHSTTFAIPNFISTDGKDVKVMTEKELDHLIHARATSAACLIIISALMRRLDAAGIISRASLRETTDRSQMTASSHVGLQGLDAQIAKLTDQLTALVLS